jgi:hypothetical protein
VREGVTEFDEEIDEKRRAVKQEQARQEHVS